jgi:hydroxypyruvate reductase
MMRNDGRRRRLLQIGALPPEMQARAEALYDITPLWTQPNRAAFLSAKSGYFDGALTMSRHGCDETVFACLGARKEPTVLACFGVGAEKIDLGAARDNHVAISTTPDVLTECVADLAFALLLTTVRRVVAADRFVQRGDWERAAFPLATRVSGKRLGIIGLGRIGLAIARRASGFSMEVRYNGRRRQPEMPYRFVSDLIELAEWSDILMISCQGGPATRHLVSVPALRALGPNGTLINIARGSVVDEAALIAALAANQIAGAGLDVFENEPYVPAGLLDDDRVVVLPHMAASTRETRQAVETLVLENLASFFATGRVLTPPV